MIKQIFEIVPASELPKESGEYFTSINVPDHPGQEKDVAIFENGEWLYMPQEYGEMASYLRPAKGLFIPEEKAEEFVRGIWKASRARASDDFHATNVWTTPFHYEPYNVPDFDEFYNNLMKEK